MNSQKKKDPVDDKSDRWCLHVEIRGRKIKLSAEGFVRKGFGFFLIGAVGYLVCVWGARVLAQLLGLGG